MKGRKNVVELRNLEECYVSVMEVLIEIIIIIINNNKHTYCYTKGSPFINKEFTKANYVVIGNGYNSPNIVTIIFCLFLEKRFCSTNPIFGFLRNRSKIVWH